MSKDRSNPLIIGPQDDPTGRDRYTRNVLAGWAVELVVIISGFIAPRLIDVKLGQVDLGLWDLGWSVTSYFRFLGLGLAGGLNRYVALHSASGNTTALRRMVSSTIALQCGVAVLTLIILCVVLAGAPFLISEFNDELVIKTKGIVIFLGGTLIARMLAWPARGILSGFHMWSVNARVNIIGDVGGLVAIVLTLSFGAGIVSVCASYFFVTVAAELYRVSIARKSYGSRLYSPSSVRLREVKELFIFGVKSNLGEMPNLIATQTLSIMLAIAAGPAVLAVYARALALQRHTQVLIRSFTMLLTSTSGSLKGLGRDAEFKGFFISSMRVSLAMTAPLYVGLAIFGDSLVRIWMGEHYVVPGLIEILCLGMIVPTSHAAAFRILVGINEHGRPALVSFVSVLVLLGLLIAGANITGWSPHYVAASLGVSLTIGSALPITIYACRRFSVSLLEYARLIAFPTILANTPFISVLAAGTKLGVDSSVYVKLSVLVLAAVVLFVSYWYLILGKKERSILCSKVLDNDLMLRVRGLS